MELSKRNLALIEAYDRGYRVINNTVYTPSGEVLTGCPNDDGYIQIHCKHGVVITVHRLVAYQKFGNRMFETGIQVRHLNGNPSNNHEYNIDIGTRSDNQLDRCPEERFKHAIKASNNIRKFTDDEVKRIREYHKITRSYKDTMSFWGISSKGTLHHLLNNRYVTKK